MATRGRDAPGGRRLRRGLRARRWLALLVLAFVAFLYYRPLVAYLDARSALDRRSAEVGALRAEQRALVRRLRGKERPEAIVREARELSYVRPGERLFIVTGIATWRRERAAERRGRGATLGRDG